MYISVVDKKNENKIYYQYILYFMSTLIKSYRHLQKATQKLVNLYSSHICLNYLSLKDNATDAQVEKNMNELRKYYTSPEFSYIVFKKNN
tara:strand:+ start:194 stop:463 length:270 start_codon:yes stop_codon:yes gene_type:complete